MIPTPESIKFKFSNAELIDFAALLHFILTRQRYYDKNSNFNRIIEAGQLDSMKKLYNRLRIKIEDFEGFKTGKRTLKLKRTEYSAFYALMIFDETEYNLKNKMLINKLLTSIDKI